MARDTAIRIVVDNTQAKGALKEVNKELVKTQKQSKKTESSFAAFTKKLKGAKAPILAVAAAIGAVGFAIGKTGDEMRVAESRIGRFTNSAEETTQVMLGLADVSQRTFTSIQDNADLYARFATVTGELGLSQAQLLDVTESLQLSFRLSGASASEAANSAVQLAQAMGAGGLRGDEFNSIIENNVVLIQKVAKEMNVSVGELRAMSREGKITSTVLANSLLKSLEELRAESDEIAVSIPQAFSQLTSTFVELAVEIDKAVGISTFFSSVIIAINNDVRELAVSMGVLEEANRAEGGAVVENTEATQEQLQTYDELKNTLEVTIARINDQTASFGLSTRALADLQAQYDRDDAEARIDKMVQQTKITEEQAEKLKAVIQREHEHKKILNELTEDQEALAAAEERRFEQLKKSQDEYLKKQNEMRDAVEGWATSFTDSLIDGKANFKDFATSIIKDIARIATQRAIISFLDKLFPATTDPTVGPGLPTSTPTLPNAMGNAFVGGKVVPFARGGVVSKPTLFPMADGAGLMGEAGPEAIMPLKRGRDGKLGVAGGGTVVNVYNESSAEVDTRVSQDGRTIDMYIRKAVSQGFQDGTFDRQLNSSFGISRRGV